VEASVGSIGSGIETWTIKILVVEDDLRLARAVSRYLTHQLVCHIDAAATGDEALMLAKSSLYDIAVIDWELGESGPDGLDVCRWLRQNLPSIGIVFTTAQEDLDHKVMALDAGADDYLVKPFPAPELVACIQALLRRIARTQSLIPESDAHPRRGSAQLAARRSIVIGPFHVDLSTGQARLDGSCLELTRHQFLLLVLLLERPGQIVTDAEICDRVLQNHGTVSSSCARNLVYELRRALNSRGELIKTVRNGGYVLADGDCQKEMTSAPMHRCP
jgi:DNA-binding response OmpR family regulator